jgi:hypothetical protein
MEINWIVYGSVMTKFNREEYLKSKQVQYPLILVAEICGYHNVYLYVKLRIMEWSARNY